MTYFHRTFRPRMRDSWYFQLAAYMSATLTALAILVVHAAAGIPLSVTLRATVAPILRFFAEDPDVVEWSMRSALVENAGPLFLVTFACFTAMAFLLLKPSPESDTAVISGQKVGSQKEVQRAIDAGGRKK